MIAVVKAGLYTSVQDLGRTGYLHMGVPVSGAMDAISAALANSLIGNTGQEAVLEITMLGPTLQFGKATTIALAGAPFQVSLNALQVGTGQILSIQKNDVLSIGKPTQGMRCYLAVAGGFQTPLILGSRSFYTPVTQQAILKKGDQLQLATTTKSIGLPAQLGSQTNMEATRLEVTPGPEYHTLTAMQQHAFFKQPFRVSAQSNRMAYLLENAGKFSAPEILTAPVQPGTVQLTPSGNLHVLMRDAQVTGGYARVLQLSEESIHVLAQKRGGCQLWFTLAT